jgi:polyisoprenoid-binding protein YceI
MKLLFRSLIVCSLFFWASYASASQWTMDADHSEIRFKVKHILTTVSGQFTKFDGKLLFDPQMPEAGKFDFTVAVNSVDTNNGKRDNHLRSKDFFDADKFPEMKFSSSKIHHIKDNRYVLEGVMTIKDVSQKIQIEFEFFPARPHPFDKQKNVGGFQTNFTIPRLEYHVGDGKFVKMGVVGSDVEVEIAMEALTEK